MKRQEEGGEDVSSTDYVCYDSDQQAIVESSFSKSVQTSYGTLYLPQKSESAQTSSKCTTKEASEQAVSSFSLWRLPREKKFVLLSMCWCDMSGFLCLSIMAPFFPEVTLAKNVNNTISGWIFGSFALTQFIFSPIIGKLMPKIGVRFFFLAGNFIAGSCTLLFGFMEYVSVEDGGTTFISLCFLLRVVLSIGCTAMQTAAFTICFKSFSENISSAFGISEIFVGIGMSAGPAIGGGLYALGGFVLPFSVLGGLIMLSLPFSFWVFPRDDLEELPRSGSFTTLFKVPMTVINSAAIFLVGILFSILQPTLEPHMRQFHLAPEAIGGVFLLMAAFYAISAPVCGRIADKLHDKRHLLISGFAIAGVACILIGPSPFFGIEGGLSFSIVSLIMLGISCSMALVPTFDIYVEQAEWLGLGSDVGTHCMVSGLWTAAYALGDFTGPSIGGFLMDTIGFEWMMTDVAVACAFMVIVLLISIASNGK